MCQRDRPRFLFRNAEVQAISPYRATASLFRRVFAVSMKPTRLGKHDSTQPSRATVCRDPGDSTVSSNVSGHQRVPPPFFFSQGICSGSVTPRDPVGLLCAEIQATPPSRSHRFSPRFCGGRLVLTVLIKNKKIKVLHHSHTVYIVSGSAPPRNPIEPLRAEIQATPPFSSTGFSLRLVCSDDCWQQIRPLIAPRNPTAVCRALGDSTFSSTRCSLSVCSDNCWQHIRPSIALRISTELLCGEI